MADVAAHEAAANDMLAELDEARAQAGEAQRLAGELESLKVSSMSHETDVKEHTYQRSMHSLNLLSSHGYAYALIYVHRHVAGR